MNAKKSKKVLLLASLSTLAVSTAAVMAISFNSEALKARGMGEIVDGSVTWTVSNSVKSGSSNKISWKRQSARGTDMYLYTFGQWNPSGSKLFDSKYNSANNYGVFFKSEAGNSGAMFQFQNITSLTIVTFDSQAGATYGIYTGSTGGGSAVASQTLVKKTSSEEETHTFTTEVAGARYLAIKPTSESYYFAIKSITVTYSCEPGGSSEYGISKSEDVGYTLNPSKSSAVAGEKISFSVNVATGYTLTGVSVKNGSNDVEVSGPTAGVYSFIMPYGDVEISANLTGLHHIAFGYGYKTQYSLGDTFEKPVVYAYYYDSESGETVTDSAVAAGYDMNTAGVQTVTVSYTDLAGATVSKQYTIKVIDPSVGYSVSYEAWNGSTGEQLVLSEYLLEGCVLPEKCAGGETLTLVTSNIKTGYVVGWVQTTEYADFDTSDMVTWTYTMPEYDITVMLLIFEE